MKVLNELKALYDLHLEEVWTAQNKHNEDITRIQEEFNKAQSAYNDAMTEALANYARTVEASRDKLGTAVHLCLHGDPEEKVKLPNIADAPKTNTIEVTFGANTNPLTAALKAVDEAMRQEAATG